MKKWIERLFPVDELIDTVKRFPLSVACALAMFVLAFLLTHNFMPGKDEWLGRLFAVLGCLYLWFGISKLIAESQSLNAGKQLVINIIVGGAIFVLLWFSSLWAIHLAFVLPALLLGIMFAPYLTSGDDVSFWFFNRVMWFGVIVSYVALFMFAGGLSIALAAIQMLFEIKIGHKLYSDLWLFASFVLGPLYALSWVPKNFVFTEEDCHDPPGLRFIANWITVPMVFVYLLILYAYFVKIMVTGEVPNGLLAFMITGFAGVGIVTYLIAWPMRESGTPQLRLFYKIFFPMLLIPVGFHFYAIWERISTYGITEQRYVVLLSALWFAIMAFSNTMSRIPIKAIPATLCILMIFASFGPWGGVNISGMSQFSRLEKLLVKHEILKDGRIVEAEQDISLKDRQSISSILDYLCRSERDEFIEAWFIKENQKKWSCGSGRNLTAQMGFDYVSKYGKSRANTPQSERFNLYPKGKNYVQVKGYDVLVSNLNVYARRGANDEPWSQDRKVGDDYVLKLEFDEPWMSVQLDTYEPIRVDMHDYIAGKIDLKPNDLKTMYIEGETPNIDYRIRFRSIRGKVIKEEPQIDNLSFDFLFRIKE